MITSKSIQKIFRYLGITGVVIFYFQYFIINGRKLISVNLLPYLLFISIACLLINLVLKINDEIKEGSFRLKNYMPMIFGLISTIVILLITLLFI